MGTPDTYEELRVGMSSRGSGTEMGKNGFQKKEHDQGINKEQFYEVHDNKNNNNI